ncbi:hypothetical protein NQ318_015632 [Aromia moschata]|uniref:SET domain-containing protein n=1 Tax=Aromia moschata TaxID=1265417 RepID=A0AAV8XEL4_9CUCU|nr:hypothetical protein NQ318_015632 [Aromia moschata]
MQNYQRLASFQFKLQTPYNIDISPDIDRALQNNYPEHLKDKLVQRRNQAERLIANQKNVHYYSPAPTIQNRNPRIDAASDSVEIRRNSKFGRLIVATKDIKVGDVIVSENSFAHIIHPESRYLHCHECLDICFNLIPCERCNALYCSESCLERAFNDCHKYECGMAFLFHKYPQLFIRLAIKGLREHQNHGDATLDETYRSDRYKEISELATNENKRDFLNTCVHITIVCLCYHNLIENPHFRRDFDLDAVDDLLKKLLYHSYMIHAFNPFNIKKLKYTALQTRSRRVGTAIYAFTSLLNHSCVPNCEFFHHGTVLVTRAIANIRKGEQCTICYGTSYSSTDIRIRQMSLKRYYLFKCDCKACAKSGHNSRVYLKADQYHRGFKKRLHKTHLKIQKKIDIG